MKVALVSVDPIVQGCSRPTRNLALYQLAAYAAADDGRRTQCRIEPFDWALPGFGGKEGACSDTLRLAQFLIETGFDVVGFSTKIWNYYHVRNIARLVKRAAPATTILAGGPQVSGRRFPPLMLHPGEPFDFLVTGEGEVPFLHILRSLLGSDDLDECPGLWRRTRNGAPELRSPGVMTDLSLLPSAFNRHGADDFAHRAVIVEASRGCPFKCRYCNAAATTTRFFPLERVFSEIDHVMSRRGSTILFADGTLNLNCRNRYQPMLEFLVERQRFYVNKFGPDFKRNGRILFCLRPERMTKRSAELMEELVTISDETIYEFGLQSTGEEAGRLSGRPYHESRWMCGVERLGPRALERTAIDLIADLPGNTLEDIAESHRIALKTGAGSTMLCRLFLLPGTALEEDTEKLNIAYDPYPPHRVTSWLGRDGRYMRDLVGFGMLSALLTNRLRRLWLRLEELDPPDLHLGAILLRLDGWLQRRGDGESVYSRLNIVANAYGETDSPRLFECRRWVHENILSLFREFSDSVEFIRWASPPETTMREVRRLLDAELGRWWASILETRPEPAGTS
jgi:radical SAM superfamily enzyme YgiQ (UPF0313 family)